MRSGYAVSAPRRTLSDVQDEIDALSPEEKERLFNEIYGYSNNTVVETDELIQTSLDQMEISIQEIISSSEASNTDINNNIEHDNTPEPHHSQYYQRAKEVCPDLVNDNDNRLRFLRCELFDTKVN